MSKEISPTNDKQKSSSDQTKPSLSEWIGEYLPFQLPSIPFVKTAKNLDAAIGRVVAAVGENAAIRIDKNTKLITAKSSANEKAIIAAGKFASKQIESGDPLAERALEYAYRDSILKQTNREKIAQKASEELRDNPPTLDASSDIESEWLSHFARLAENVSSEDIQSMWARILAGEIKHPGAFRLRTLQELSLLSREDAKFVHRILSLSIGNSFIFRDDDKFINVSDALAAEHFGILSVGGNTLSLKQKFTDEVEQHFVCGNLALRVFPKKTTTLQLPVYPLTVFGRELTKIAGDFIEVKEYLRAFGHHLKQNDIGDVFLAKIGKYDPTQQGHPVLSEIELK